MGFFFWLLGGFLAVAVIAAILREKVRRFLRSSLGTSDLRSVVNMMGLEGDDQPRSINAADSIILPRILRDFPDFDDGRAKELIREYLLEKLGEHEGYRLHRLAIVAYEPSAIQKTIVYQAAIEWREQGAKVQKRFGLRYCFILDGTDNTVAANCPNCGSPLGYGVRVCSYCGSRIANVLGQTWKITELREV